MYKTREAYSKIPGLERLEKQIQSEGIKYNKMILLDSIHANKAASELALRIDALKREKSELLEKNGYSPDYLEMEYQCPRCRDTGFIQGFGNGAVKCVCYKQQIIKYIYRHSNLSLLKEENFELFDEALYPDIIDEKKYGIKISPRQNIRVIKDICMEFIHGFNSREVKNLFFTGPAGVGKTFMSNCISKELIENGHTVLYQTAPMLFNIIYDYKTKAFSRSDYDATDYRNIFDVDLLIIDDLGTESPSGSRYAELLNILNVRQTNNNSRPCKTIMSTNIDDIKELYRYYDERIASRIIGSYTLLRFTGDDIRRVKKVR